MVALRPSLFNLWCVISVVVLGGALQACSPPNEQPPAIEAEVERQPLTESTIDTEADTYLTFGSANQNHGDELILRLQASGSNRAILRMDQAEIDTAVGTGTLLTATLRLPISSTATNWGDGRTIVVHRMTQAWTELGATANCAIDANTGNSSADCEGETDWDMMGSEDILPFVYEATDTAIITSGMTGVVELDVTADVAAFLSGAANQGWLLRKGLVCPPSPASTLSGVGSAMA